MHPVIWTKNGRTYGGSVQLAYLDSWVQVPQPGFRPPKEVITQVFDRGETLRRLKVLIESAPT